MHNKVQGECDFDANSKYWDSYGEGFFSFITRSLLNSSIQKEGIADKKRIFPSVYQPQMSSHAISYAIVANIKITSCCSSNPRKTALIAG